MVTLYSESLLFLLMWEVMTSNEEHLVILSRGQEFVFYDSIIIYLNLGALIIFFRQGQHIRPVLT